ncbi:MAG: sensor signal transduction histidine kinase [Bacteroidetes bacterium]|uniref:sensor histidine kinase n=1 Tax=unclassified Chitinophaga TaxID=2619133 RepID=UPI0009D008C5|nr:MULTISPECIES: ATP-binding protein [unclassified Chitinophaga]MBP1651019.1 sensor signal transduction histidine kinase [Bacteroidota bacterium]OMP76516.1 histidine kinase [[Flexibacter] sp. ATCC 35208]WPV63967.1 ATP-binding protein [Chitinophaga sp. LS1]
MPERIESFARDIEKVQQIAIVPSLLEVICRTTGMGFSAIARVTKDRWIACGVRDEINFGLVPGGELEVGTTICDEIRDSGKAVVIDHVAEDPLYRNHHTPRMYGIQSYISVPIILKNGEFFGTLCAIDPRPAKLIEPKIVNMFQLYAELLAFHLQSQETILEMSKQLKESIEENKQYQFISHHNLQEPLRKLRLFSDILIDAVDKNMVDKAKEYAVRINNNAQRVSMMIRDLSEYSGLNDSKILYESVDLDKVVRDVCIQLSVQGAVTIGPLPVISGINSQIEQLFYHLIHNAVKFVARERPLQIDISGEEVVLKKRYIAIRVADNGTGIEKQDMEKVFDIFSHMQSGVGLAYCRKIVRNHGGDIQIDSTPGVGTTFTLLLPLEN